MKPQDGKRERHRLDARGTCVAALCAGALFAFVAAAQTGLLPFASTPAPSGNATKPGMLLAALGIVAWGYSIWMRCSDVLVRRDLIAVSVLLAGWLLLVTLKYPTDNDLAVSIMWYLFYVPMLFVSSLCLLSAMRVALPGQVRTMRTMRRVLFAVDAVLVVFVLTNNLHHAVFSFNFANPLWSHVYGYEPGYWVVFACIIAQYVAAFSTLAVVASGIVRRALALPALVAFIAAGYAINYLLGRMAGSNMSLTFSIAVIVALEAALEMGVFPSFHRYKSLFFSLPFDLKVVDEKGAVNFETNASKPLGADIIGLACTQAAKTQGPAAFHAPNLPDARITSYRVLGGFAIVTEDIGILIAQRRELQAKHAQLKRRNFALSRRNELEATLARRKNEEEVWNLIDATLKEKMNSINALLEGLFPDADHETVRACLAQVKLLMGWCKHEGALVLASEDGLSIRRERVDLAMQEMAQDLRQLGIDAAVLTDLRSDADVATISAAYDCLYDMAEAARVLDDAVFLAYVSDDGQGPCPKGCALRISVEGSTAGRESFEARIEAVRAGLLKSNVSFELKSDEAFARLSAQIAAGRLSQ